MSESAEPEGFTETNPLSNELFMEKLNKVTFVHFFNQFRTFCCLDVREWRRIQRAHPPSGPNRTSHFQNRLQNRLDREQIGLDGPPEAARKRSARQSLQPARRPAENVQTQMNCRMTVVVDYFRFILIG